MRRRVREVLASIVLHDYRWIIAAAATVAVPLATTQSVAHPAASHAKRGNATPVAIPATGKLGEADLLGIARIALTKRHDQFANDATARFAGREFVLFQSVASGEQSDRLWDSTWDYDRDKQTMTFRYAPSEMNQVQMLYHNTPEGSFIGRTAMNVRFRISLSSSLDVHLQADYKGFSGILHPDLEMSVPVAPELGRKLAGDVVLEVDGVLTGGSGGVADCSYEDMTASLDDPTEERRETCVLTAAIKRIAFVSRSTNTVLKDVTAGGS